MKSIEPAAEGRLARVELTIGDEAWPLTQGTKMILRWGGTVSYANRYIALFPGPAGAPALADGADFPTRTSPSRSSSTS